jgi:acetylornithine deacetylase
MSELRSRALLAELVGFATVSRDSNLALIEFVRDYLHGLGVSSELIYNAERTKANLLASIGPSVPGGVVLSGHTDVVPADGQAWTVEPFRLTEMDGKLFGRYSGHERLPCFGAGSGADIPRQPAAAPGAPGIFL